MSPIKGEIEIDESAFSDLKPCRVISDRIVFRGSEEEALAAKRLYLGYLKGMARHLAA